MVPLASFALGVHFVIAVADKVPDLAVDQTCRAEADRTRSSNRNLSDCLSSEHDARQQLESRWNQYTASERARCTSTATMGGEPSYVELLTCLEMAKQADKLPHGELVPGVRTK